jgi:hypothetical protein
MAYTVVNSSYNFFKSLTYTGNGGTQSVTGINFKPDFLWIKDRSNANDHKLQDSVRGSTYTLEANTDTDEFNDTNAITSFNSNGFTTGANGNTNTNSATYSAWSWNCDAAASVSYTVKVVSDGGNKYRFNDFGTSAVTLDLEEGGTYTFDGSDSSMASHPIKLSTTANGTHGGGSSYNTGVTYLLDGSSVTESAYVSGYASATTRKLQITVAASAPTLYYYCHYHSGMGGQANTNATRGSSNFGGTIQSRAVFATAPGISVVTYTGTGSAATVGHGLGVAPDLVLIKKRDGGSDAGWLVYHNSLGNATAGRLDVDNGNPLSGSDLFNSTSPTTNNFSIGTNTRCNDNGSTYVAYCFASIKGFSHIGNYQGTGITDNGPYVYTGFKPAFMIVKNFPDDEHWRLYDVATNPGYNKSGYYVVPSDPGSATSAQDSGRIDFMANGFKIRGNGSFISGDNDNHIYWAFAQNPFVGGGIAATAL